MNIYFHEFEQLTHDWNIYVTGFVFGSNFSINLLWIEYENGQPYLYNYERGCERMSFIYLKVSFEIIVKFCICLLEFNKSKFNISI